MVDVQNPANIQPLQTFYPNSSALTTPHNPYVMGNNFAVVSCYQDGVYIFDISQPQNVKQVGFYDTFPQGGYNLGNYTLNSDYSGNWGAYPYLPSGVLVANDMQNGIFILDPAAAYTTTSKAPVNPLGIGLSAKPDNNFFIFPNPASRSVALQCRSTGESVLEVHNLLGQLIYSRSFTGEVNDYLDVEHFDSGIYVLTLENAEATYTRKLQVNH
jgi:hypothetical protein